MNLVLTNNFYTWLRTIVLQTSTVIDGTTSYTVGPSNTSLDTVGRIVDETGVTQTKVANGSSSSTVYYPNDDSLFTLNCWKTGATSNQNSDYIYFAIGDSTEPPTADDYTLGGTYVLNEDYTASWRAISNARMVGEKGRLSFVFSVTALRPITIGDVGLFKSLSTTPTRTSRTEVYNALFGRAALDNPVELSTGETVSFQIDIEF